MNLDPGKASRLLMVLNFVLTAGVVVAGADFFTGEEPLERRSSAFRDVKPPPQNREEPESIFRDYSAITGEKFRTRGESGRRTKVAARPGAGSALENSLRVLGTMLSNNEAFNSAIVEDIHTRKQHTVGVGDMVGSVKIVSIRSEAVEVLLHGEKTTLPLDWKSSVPERGKSKRGARGGVSRGPWKKTQAGGAPRGDKGKKGDGRGGKAGPPGPKGSPGDDDEIAGHLAKMSPELEKWWKQQTPEAQERWKKWWLNKSPEDRKKWEKKLIKIAKSGKGGLK